MAVLEKAAALRPLPKATYPLNKVAFRMAMQIMQINPQVPDLINADLLPTLTESAVPAMASP